MHGDDGSSLSRLYASLLVDLEIAKAMNVRNTEVAHKPIITYLLSTPNRRLFGLVLSRDALRGGDGVYPSAIAKQVGCSRNALDTIIYEAEGYDIASVSRDARGHRIIKSTEILNECFRAYADWVLEYTGSSGILGAGSAAYILRKAPIDLA